MVCKEDVVSWFKELESYKRIDAMCTLLNMCLPFELRFIGTYLEELGKRDFQELRGAELRANNHADLVADIGGANADPRTRRKMALYVSLLRSCNFACATTLYNVMVGLEQSGLLKGLNGDLLEEILLLYTMALHHPAFTFDQRTHFGEILEKLKAEEQRVTFGEAQIEEQLCVPPNLSVPPPNIAGIPPPPGLVYVKPHTPLQGPPSSSSDGVVSDLTTPVSVMPLLSEVHHPPPPPPGLPPLPHFNVPNLPDYVVAQAPWPPGLIVSAINPPIEVLNYGQGTGVGGSGSPLGSSPADSRPGSPRRRRPSRDRLSPPLPAPETSAPLPPPLVLPHLQAAFENLSVNEMRRMEDERLRELGVPHSAVQRLRSVEKLNGVRRRASTAGSTGAYCVPTRSSGSESGSSAASSPPGTPAPPQPRRPGPPHTAPPAPPYPFVPFAPPRGFPAAYPAPPYRPPPPPFANGEPQPYGPAGAPYGGFVPVMFAAPKLSCWNCGAGGHAGHECKEPSMEEMTRAGGYQLDYGSAPPDPGDK